MAIKLVKDWATARNVSLGYESREVADVYSKLDSRNVLLESSPKLQQRRENLVANFTELLGPLLPQVISVLDVGGGNGYFLDILENEFPRTRFDYKVLETETISRIYKEKFKPRKNLSFHSDFGEIELVDVCIFSCFLQYVDNPEYYLENAISRTNRILVMRHPEIEDSEELFGIQTIENHEASRITVSWPIHIFAKGWLYSYLTTRGFKLIKKFWLDQELVEFEEGRAIKMISQSFSR